ncbi:hypothetical protein BK126_03135 [Paenibacillus sp. FSL H7-0326]|uniref:hypothetical protein n=1 Tax=Paenibacillus sp. FSL H7-0326 TaxID=1921144 RepID=UPI00096E0BEB|nr:hypothetical protein [Paenibacillus sp. FSL H7-0326]OMC71122.1 hypothetical protein BK126_03135 [Paenibacillus sp. FSL H7-0326]
MAGKGWISMHRKMLDNPIVCKDSDHMAVWVYLLLNAAHAEYPALFSGERITLQPGQLITGRKSISEKLKISESKVQRILKSFENEQQIEQLTSSKNRLVTLVSWSEYQDCEQQNEQQVNNKRTTTEQQVNTNNNVNKINNENKKNKEDIYTPEFEIFWNSYPRKIGKKECFKTWKTVTKKEDPDVIIQCSQNYKKQCELRKTETQFIKHPKTFLNEERYKDYLEEERKNESIPWSITKPGVGTSENAETVGSKYDQFVRR